MTFFPTFRKPFLLFLPSYYSKKVQFFLSKKKNVNIIFCRVPFSYLEKNHKNEGLFFACWQSFFRRSLKKP